MRGQGDAVNPAKASSSGFGSNCQFNIATYLGDQTTPIYKPRKSLPDNGSSVLHA